VGTHSTYLRQHLSLVHLSASLFVLINHTELCTSALNMQQQAVTAVSGRCKADSAEGISFTQHW
jgi:hypothetical protein